MLACVVVALSLASDVGVVGVIVLGASPVPLQQADVVGVDAILARIDATTTSSSKPNARAVELVQRGEELLLSFEHARAAAALGEAAALLEPTLSAIDFDTWTRARTLAGVAWMESGNGEAAKDAFTRLLALHPEVVPDASLLSPAARAAFDAARADVSARGTGALEVRARGVEAATIVVDGRVRGKAPLSLAGLAAGTHRVLVSAPGFETAAADVRVDANALVPHDVTLAPTRQRRTLASLSPDAAPATVLPELRALVADARLEALLLVGVAGDVVRVRRVVAGESAAETTGESAPRGVHVAREPRATLDERVRAALSSSAKEWSDVDFDATLLGRPRTPTAAVVAPDVDEGTDWLFIGAIGGGVLVVAAAALAVVALWPQPVPERTLVVALELPAP